MDPAMLNELGGLDENDPRSLGRFMRKMASETGEEMGPEFNEIVGRLEKGEDPEKIEQSMGDILGDGGAPDGMDGMGGMMGDDMGMPPAMAPAAGLSDGGAGAPDKPSGGDKKPTTRAVRKKEPTKAARKTGTTSKKKAKDK